MSLKAPELNAVSFCCLRFSLLSVPVCLQAFALCSREFMCVVSCVLFFALCFSCFVSLLLDVGRARFAGEILFTVGGQDHLTPVFRKSCNTEWVSM